MYSMYIFSMIYSQYEYVSCLFTLGVSQISGFSKLVKYHSNPELWLPAMGFHAESFTVISDSRES